MILQTNSFQISTNVHQTLVKMKVPVSTRSMTSIAFANQDMREKLVIKVVYIFVIMAQYSTEWTFKSKKDVWFELPLSLYSKMAPNRTKRKKNILKFKREKFIIQSYRKYFPFGKHEAESRGSKSCIFFVCVTALPILSGDSSLGFVSLSTLCHW